MRGKKFLLVSLFILLAVSAFAQRFQFSTWGRGIFVPLWVEVPQEGDNEVKTGMGRWTTNPRVGIDITGNASGRVGVELGMNYDAGEQLGVTTHKANIWAKPFPWIKLTYGQFEDLTLVGKIDDTELAFIYGQAHYGRNDLFTAFYGQSGKGVLLNITPDFLMDGIYFGALVNTSFTSAGRPADEAEDTFKSIQVGAGYEIKDIGHARLQYVGPQPNGARPDGFGSARLEAAFAYTGIQGVVLDAGVKIPFPDKEEGAGGTEDVYQDAYQAGIGTLFNPFGSYWVWARFDCKFGWFQTIEALNRKYTEEFNWAVYFVNSWDFSFAQVGADFSVESRPERRSKNTASGIETISAKGGYYVGLGPWIRFACGNAGFVKVAAVFKLPTEVNGVKNNFVFTIPVAMQIDF
jgi:hypothetical protein